MEIADLISEELYIHLSITMEDGSVRGRSGEEGSKTLRHIFELGDPGDEKDAEEESRKLVSQRSRVNNPFFRDPLILPKVSRHLRVLEG
jgi:hypothetical protein